MFTIPQQETRKKITPENFKSFHRQENKLYFKAANATLEVWVISDFIIRFRYTTNIFDRDFSYALVDDIKETATNLQYFEIGKYIEIHTGKLICFVEKENLRVSIEDLKGNIISEDSVGFHWEMNKHQGGNFVYCTKKIQPAEYFYGLGDKPTDLNLRGKRFTNWGTDTYGFQRDQDPLYRNIPFYYGLHKGKGYGLFFDNSFKSYFDFGYENEDVTSFWAEGGELNYYFIYGPELLSVAERYTDITGRPDLPPMWALGYQQSKWSYYPEKNVRALADEFRSREIPCDVIHLDIDYMDGYRCFTWNKSYFPDPKKMISDLNNQGFKTVVIIDPGIKVDPEYSVYKEAFEKGYFCKRQDGDLMHGNVWPGDCNFPDFTNPAVRAWWSNLYKELIAQGVKGVWNDMNEPAVFEQGTFPDDVRHHYEGADVSHRRAHNVYGMQMARASYEGVKKFMAPARPFILTRSGYCGVQRYSAIWTGDNVASFEHVLVANMQCQRMSISGVSFVGTDIGGFIGEPDGELFVRYIQMAIFHPFFRGHSSSDQGDKEPWAFGSKYEAHIKEAIELRYKFLPYIYSTFWQYSSRGTPMIRPLSFITQYDSQTLYRQDEFGFGDNIIACPIQERSSEGRWMFLPRGTWYNYFNDDKVTGGTEFYVPVEANTFPLFVKAGSVLPHAPVQQYVGEKKTEKLTLHVYHGNSRYKTEFYEDDGDGFDYKMGKSSVRRFTVLGNNGQMRILQYFEGYFNSFYKDFEIVIHGLPYKARAIKVDGIMIRIDKKQRKENLTFTVHKDFKRIEVL